MRNRAVAVGFLRAVAATYPNMRFIPTGGITEESLPDYLGIPSVIACGGSWLVPPDLVAKRDFDRMTELASAAAAAARAAGVVAA